MEKCNAALFAKASEVVSHRGEMKRKVKAESGWPELLRSDECRKVLAQVAALRKKGERVYPVRKDVFRAFKDCPFDKVRVVILGQDPYANEGQAIGRAFAVPESTEKVPPSLKNIFTEVLHDYPRQLRPKPTLESWAKQGVFLLNATLTVEHGRRNRHANIGWKEAVTIPTLEKLSADREHLVFMLWGVPAKKFEQFQISDGIWSLKRRIHRRCR
jgi:uracil-DNA glycosylase